MAHNRISKTLNVTKEHHASHVISASDKLENKNAPGFWGIVFESNLCCF